ncbi:MAG: hypothetical protein MJ252_14635 [archaeon]|nr:hypothetical protein [archaeon]
MSKAKQKQNSALPARFQEVLVESEIQLAEGLTVDVLKKLVYLYTLAMNHYNLEGKIKMQQFYSDKLLGLLTRPDVAEFLDKNQVNINDHSNLNLFPEEKNKENNQKPKPAVKKSAYSKIVSQTAGNVKRKIKTREPFDKEKALKIIREKILNLDEYIRKIDVSITNDIMVQMDKYEENKRKNNYVAKPTPPSVSPPKEIVDSPKRSAGSIGSASDSEDEDALLSQIESNMKKENEAKKEEEKKEEKKEEEKKEEIIKKESSGNIPAAGVFKRRVSIGNNMMLKEIEDYIKKNMDEENEETEQIRKDYEAQIKESGEDFAEIYKEEMEEAIENLQSQYKERREKEVEKIRKKYQRKPSVILLAQPQP